MLCFNGRLATNLSKKCGNARGNDVNRNQGKRWQCVGTAVKREAKLREAAARRREVDSGNK